MSGNEERRGDYPIIKASLERIEEAVGKLVETIHGNGENQGLKTRLYLTEERVEVLEDALKAQIDNTRSNRKLTITLFASVIVAVLTVVLDKLL